MNTYFLFVRRQSTQTNSRARVTFKFMYCVRAYVNHQYINHEYVSEISPHLIVFTACCGVSIILLANSTVLILMNINVVSTGAYISMGLQSGHCTTALSRIRHTMSAVFVLNSSTIKKILFNHLCTTLVIYNFTKLNT